jgi:hypothetical protein
MKNSRMIGNVEEEKVNLKLFTLGGNFVNFLNNEET